MQREDSPYQIFEQIGWGSSARVFSAVDADLNKVAIKVFEARWDLDGEKVIDDLKRELKIVQSLQHPNIVRYLDWGTQDGAPFLVMEPLATDTLNSRIRRNRGISARETDAFLYPIAGALDYLHSRNILHRDVKPSNILFDEVQKPYLADFDLAHLLSPRHDSMPAGDDFEPGTAEFLAPEVMNGAPASPASDIYSLALTVYYSLSRVLPTDGRSQHLRNVDRVNGRLIPLTKRNPHISPEMNDVVMRGLAPDPRIRYSTAMAFAETFRRSPAESESSGTAIGESVESARVFESTPQEMSEVRSAIMSALESTQPEKSPELEFDSVLPTRTRVFVSYSHKDKKWLGSLLEHLDVLQREGRISVFVDSSIEVGTGWKANLDAGMRSAKIGVLLVSASFLTSDFIRDEEVPTLFHQHRGAGMILYPLLLRPCAWNQVPWLSELQLRPPSARPLSSFSGSQREQQLADVANEIAKIVGPNPRRFDASQSRRAK